MKARPFLAVLLAALLTLLGLGGAGWWLVWRDSPLQLQRQIAAPPRAAQFVPRQADLALYLLSDGRQPVAYARAVAPLAKRNQAVDAISRLRDGAFAAAGLDYEAELSGWLAAPIALALFEPPPGQAAGAEAAPGWLLALGSRDDGGARRFLQRFWQTRSLAGTDLQVSRYRGKGLISGRGALGGRQPLPLATALIDDDLVLIASGRQILEEALDVSQIAALNQAALPELQQSAQRFGPTAALLVARAPALERWLGLSSLNGPLFETNPTAAPSAPGEEAPAREPAPPSAPGKPEAEPSALDSEQASSATPDDQPAAASQEPLSAGSQALGAATPEDRAPSAPSAAAGAAGGASAAGATALLPAPESPVPQDLGTEPASMAADSEGASAPVAGNQAGDNAAGDRGPNSTEPPPAIASAPDASDASPAAEAASIADESLAGGGGLDTPSTQGNPQTVPEPVASEEGPTAGSPGDPAGTPPGRPSASATSPSAATASRRWPHGASPAGSTVEAILRQRRWPGGAAPAFAATAPTTRPASRSFSRPVPGLRSPGPSALNTAATDDLSPPPRGLVLALRPQGTDLLLQADLVLGGPLPPGLDRRADSGELQQQLMAGLRGPIHSLALLDNPAAWRQLLPLRPLFNQLFGARGAGPLPALVAAADQGLLVAADGPLGWQLGTDAEHPPLRSLEAPLAATGLIAAPLDQGDRSLLVWTRLQAVPTRTSRPGGERADQLQATLAGWWTREGQLAWWGRSLAQLRQEPSNPERLRQLQALARPLAPLQWALDGESARALLADWQPWRLLTALAGGGLEGSISGLALAAEPSSTGLALQARLELG